MSFSFFFALSMFLGLTDFILDPEPTREHFVSINGQEITWLRKGSDVTSEVGDITVTYKFCDSQYLLCIDSSSVRMVIPADFRRQEAWSFQRLKFQILEKFSNISVFGVTCNDVYLIAEVLPGSKKSIGDFSLELPVTYGSFMWFSEDDGVLAFGSSDQFTFMRSDAACEN